MQALKPNDVQARVVAWHNSHPLARRIQPSQVHSIGAVELPFASDQALTLADAPLQSQTEHQAEAQTQTLPHGQGLRRRSPPPAAEPAADAEPPTALAAAESAPALQQALQPASESEPAPEPPRAGLRRLEEAEGDDPLAPVEAGTEAVNQNTAIATEAPLDTDPIEPSSLDALAAELDEAAAAEAADIEDVQAAAELPGPDAEPPTLEAEFVMAGEAPEATDGEASDGAAADPAADPAADTEAEPAPAPAEEADARAVDLAEPGPEAADAVAAEASQDTEAPAAAEAAPALDGAQTPDTADLTAGLAAPEPHVQDIEAAEAAQAGQPPVTTEAPETEAAAAPPLATRLQAAKAAALAGEQDRAAESMPANPASTALSAAGATVGAAAPPPWWRRFWPWGGQAASNGAPAARSASTPKLGKLVPLFNPKFLWPLSPQQVAQWARQHAALSPMAPGDWPRRALQAEPALLQQARSKSQRHTGQMHVLTAAIGVGDRRIRVLIGADGQVLGPRAIDKRRIAVVAGVALFMATVVVSRWPQHDAADAEALPAEAAASAPAPHAQAVADAHRADTPAAEAHAAVEPRAAAGSAPQVDAQGTDAPPATPSQTSTAEAASSAPAPLTVTSTPPPRFPERRAKGPLANIRPQLSAEERLIARQQSEAARGTDQAQAQGKPEPTSSSPVAANLRFAVVTLASAQREPAEAYLAQLLSVRAQMPSPGTARTELVQQQGQWRAALWPFATVGDAERARTMLATRGLKTEVVAF